MIRTACLAALLAAGAVLPVQMAGATVPGGARISEVVAALRGGSHFDQGSFTFAIARGGSMQTLFSGIAGVRAFSDLNTLNNFVNTYDNTVYNGGSYQFTHSVITSYFGGGASTPAPSVFDGGTYQFTHSVLDSYFQTLTNDNGAGQSAQVALVDPMPSPPAQNVAVPEPASWAMMFGGFAIVGMAMRRRKIAASFA